MKLSKIALLGAALAALGYIGTARAEEATSTTDAGTTAATQAAPSGAEIRQEKREEWKARREEMKENWQEKQDAIQEKHEEMKENWQEKHDDLKEKIDAWQAEHPGEPLPPALHDRAR